MNYAQLRNLLEPLVTDLKDSSTHSMLPKLCEALGMPEPAVDGSKRERMTASFNALADTDLPKVARKLLMRHPPRVQTPEAPCQAANWPGFKLCGPRHEDRQLTAFIPGNRDGGDVEVLGERPSTHVLRCDCRITRRHGNPS